MDETALKELIKNKYDRELTPVVLDFETYFGPSRHPDADNRTCSLAKLSYSEYVGHPSFDFLLVAYKKGNGPTEVLPPDELEKLYDIDWANALLICHNSLFDAYALTVKFEIQPAAHFDTLAAARLLTPGIKHDLDFLQFALNIAHLPRKRDLSTGLVNARGKTWERLTEEERRALCAYGANDTEVTHEIFKRFLPRMPAQEIRLMDWTTRLFCNPALELDFELMREAQAEDSERTQRLLEACGHSREELRSDNRFAEILIAKGIEPPTKWSEKQGKKTWAFSKQDLDFVELWKNTELIPLLDAKLAVNSSIVESRTKRLINIATACDGKLPVAYNYWGASTGRWSGSNRCNLQNLGRGSKIRRAIRAPRGHVLVVCDSAQIEARVLAWLAKHTELIEQFRNSADVYSLFATKVYGRPVDRKREEIHPETGKKYKPHAIEGHVGKVCVLGLGYGMSAAKFQGTMALGAMGGPRIFFSDQEAQHIVATYRDANRPIPEYWSALEKMLRNMNNPKTEEHVIGPLRFGYQCIKLPNNAEITYPLLESTEDGYFYGYARAYRLYGAKVCENVTQAIARHIIAEQLLAVDAEYPVAMTTHDELVCCVPEAIAEETLAFMLQTMKTPPLWAEGLPLDAEGGYDHCYSK